MPYGYLINGKMVVIIKPNRDRIARLTNEYGNKNSKEPSFASPVNIDFIGNHFQNLWNYLCFTWQALM